MIKMLYHLRHHGDAPENTTPVVNGKRIGDPLENTRAKRRKVENTNDIFNPKAFEGDNEYKNVHDSTDSNEESNEIELDSEGDIDDTFDPETGDYFKLNTEPLVTTVMKKMREKFPDASESDLRTAIEYGLEQTDSSLFEEFCGMVPQDLSWKADLTEEEIKQLEPELKRLRQNMRNNFPTIPKILNSGMAEQEKEFALQLFDIFKTLDPGTMDYINISARITNMIKSTPTSAHTDPVLNEKIGQLRAKNTNISLGEIITARLTEADKLQALQFYDIMQMCAYNTMDWFEARKRLHTILEGQLKSQEDVAKLEAEENALKGSLINFNTELKSKIFALDADPDVKIRLYEMYADMASRTPTDTRYSDLKDKLLWALKLPYRRTTVTSLVDHNPESIRAYCQNAYNCLNENIYGMKKAKEKIIQIMNDRLSNPQARSLLALKGKPGVGKTELAKAIAKAAGLPFEKISLGGSVDSTIFKGSDNVWSGSAPSLLLQILSRIKCANGVILLDEIDKLCSTEKGLEVQHALLHVLDPSQNKEFQDSFLNEFNHDLSKIWFIPAMNDDSKLDPALRDRLNIIEIPPYNREDMINIIKLHSLPKAILDKGLKLGDITITDEGAGRLIDSVGNQIEAAGMRPVENAVNDIVSKLNLLRILCTSGKITEDIPLTFTLKSFKGFPYTITTATVDHLCIRKVHSYMQFYS